MKIIYDENPLNTIVELDEHDTEVLWLKTKIDQMTWLLHGAHFYLTEREKYNHFDLDRARQECDPDYLYNEEGGKENSKIDQRIDEIMEYYIDALKNAHCGDCTCVPSACDKCHAEELLGIHTTRGLRKGPGHHVFNAFGESRENNWTKQRTLQEAIEYLENYVPHADWEGWEPSADRWKTEATDAAEWLKNYQKEHFNVVDPT